MMDLVCETLRKAEDGSANAKVKGERGEGLEEADMERDVKSVSWGAMPEAVQVEAEKGEVPIAPVHSNNSNRAESEHSAHSSVLAEKNEQGGGGTLTGKPFALSLAPMVSALPYWSGRFSDVSKELAAIAAPGPRLSGASPVNAPYAQGACLKSTEQDKGQGPHSGGSTPPPGANGERTESASHALLPHGAAQLPSGIGYDSTGGLPVRKRGRPRKVPGATGSAPPKKRARRILPALSVPHQTQPQKIVHPPHTPPPKMVSPRPPVSRLERPSPDQSPLLPPSLAANAAKLPQHSQSNIPTSFLSFVAPLPTSLFKLPGWKAAPPSLPFTAIPPAPRPTVLLTPNGSPPSFAGFVQAPRGTPSASLPAGAPRAPMCSTGSAACNGAAEARNGTKACGGAVLAAAAERPMASGSQSSAEHASSGPSSGSGADSESEPAPYQLELEAVRRLYPGERWGRFDLRRQGAGEWGVYCHPCDLFAEVVEGAGVSLFISEHLQPKNIEQGTLSKHEECLQQWLKRNHGRSGSLPKKEGRKGAYKEGPWTSEEDAILTKHVEEYGPRSWQRLRAQGLLNRHSSSCHLRWTNHVQPEMFRGSRSPDARCTSHQKEGTNAPLVQEREENEGPGAVAEVQLPDRTKSEGEGKSHSLLEQFGMCAKQGVREDAQVAPTLDEGAQDSTPAAGLQGSPEKSTPGSPEKSTPGSGRAVSEGTTGEGERTQCSSLALSLPEAPPQTSELSHGCKAGAQVELPPFAELAQVAGEMDQQQEGQVAAAGVRALASVESFTPVLENGASREGGEGLRVEAAVPEVLGSGAEADSGLAGGACSGLPAQKKARRERRRFDVAAHERGKVAEQLQLCCQCGLETRRKTKDGCMRCGVPLCKLCFVQWHEEQLQAAAMDALAVESERTVLHTGVPPAQYGSAYNLKPASGRGVHLRGNLRYGTLKCVECWPQTGRKTQHGCIKCAAALCIYCFRPWHARHDVDASLDEGKKA